VLVARAGPAIPAYRARPEDLSGQAYRMSTKVLTKMESKQNQKPKNQTKPKRMGKKKKKKEKKRTFTKAVND
jgi:hypothetical protein